MNLPAQEIVPFDFGFNQVRALLLDGQPHFIANDVSTALSYARPRDAIRAHCKYARDVEIDTDGGPQLVRLIPEGDVYRLIMRSKLPSAERFENWVVTEVLPAIRQSGKFSTQTSASFAVPATLSEALRLAADQADKIEEQKRQIEEQRPAVEFALAIRNTSDSISIGDMARVLGQGQNRFFARMRSDKILMADNRPYQNFIDRGYFRVVESAWFDSEGEPHPTFKTLITGRGQVFLQRRYGVVSEASV